MSTSATVTPKGAEGDTPKDVAINGQQWFEINASPPAA